MSEQPKRQSELKNIRNSGLALLTVLGGIGAGAKITEATYPKPTQPVAQEEVKKQEEKKSKQEVVSSTAENTSKMLEDITGIPGIKINDNPFLLTAVVTELSQDPKNELTQPLTIIDVPITDYKEKVDAQAAAQKIGNKLYGKLGMPIQTNQTLKSLGLPKEGYTRVLLSAVPTEEMAKLIKQARDSIKPEFENGYGKLIEVKGDKGAMQKLEKLMEEQRKSTISGKDEFGR